MGLSSQERLRFEDCSSDQTALLYLAIPGSVEDTQRAPLHRSLRLDGVSGWGVALRAPALVGATRLASRCFVMWKTLFEFVPDSGRSVSLATYLAPVFAYVGYLDYKHAQRCCIPLSY